MDKKFLIWENPKQAIIWLMVILMIIGCINVFSASYIAAEDMFSNGFHYLVRYGVFGAAGAAAMALVVKINYKRLLNGRFLNLAYLFVFGLLILVDVIGITNKGAQRWLYLGSLSIQPSEFAKPIVIMLAARILGRMMKKGEKVSLYQGDGIYPTLATVFYALLVYKQPDLGTAAIIMALVMCMYIVAGVSWKQVAVIVGTAVGGAVALTLSTPYRMDRIKVWFDPWLDEVGDGYQMVQSLLAIGSGGVMGTDWGQGSGKFFYLPEAHTDFAFAIFCQENGFIGALFLIIVFMLLGAAFFKIAMRTKDERGFLLVCGVSFLIIGQAAANMAMVCGILPVIGVPLVFISYGGTSMVMSMVAIALILSVYNEEVKREKLEAEGKLPHKIRCESLRVINGRRWRQ